jgi:predicted MFS family arabinose efflux permease
MAQFSMEIMRLTGSVLRENQQAMMVWACVSWMISPVVQSFLISTGPETAEAGISLNFSAMHIGVGLGTAVGGLSLEYLTISALPWVGAILATFAVGASIVALPPIAAQIDRLFQRAG